MIFSVTSSTAGGNPNTTSGVTTTQTPSAGAASNTATLTVLATPTIAKAFNPTSIQSGGSSVATLTLSNSNGSNLTGGAFTDSLSNMSAVGGAVGGTCTGTTPATLGAGATALSFSGITIPANSSCTVTFSVTSSTVGGNPNTTSGVTTTQTPSPGSPSNTATLTVGGGGAGTLGGSIGLKSGPLNARVWPIIIGNGGGGTATSAEVTSFTLLQTSGTACTPVLTTTLPAVAGDIPSGGTAPANLTIDFSTCMGTVFFKATASLSASGGAQTGTMVNLNQLP